MLEISEFYMALLKGDLTTVKGWVKTYYPKWLNGHFQKSYENALLYDDNTLLQLALLCGHLELMAYLLEAGANWQETNQQGFNALAYSVLFSSSEEQRVQAVHLLKAHNAQFPTSLHEAVYSQNAERVSAALAQGVAIDSHDNSKVTPLHYAAATDNLALIEQLVQGGAQISHANNVGYTALLLAARNGHTKSVAWLVEHGASLDEKDDYGCTALLLAATGGYTETVAWLVKHGASLAEKDDVGRAVFMRDPENIHNCQTAVLISRRRGNTPLLLAVAGGHIKTIEWLVSNGANLSEINNKGRTALLCAAGYGHTQTVAWLVAHGASLAEKDEYGSTALLEAAGNGHIETVAWLVTHGISLAEKDEDGNTALLWAARGGHTKTVTWLVEHGANLAEKNDSGVTALMQAIMGEHTETVTWLVEHGANVAEKNRKGYTALLLAAMSGYTKTVALLLEHGASLSEKNNKGATALMLAKTAGQTETVAWLLQQEASASLLKKEGENCIALLFNALKPMEAFGDKVLNRAMPSHEMKVTDLKEGAHCLNNSSGNNLFFSSKNYSPPAIAALSDPSMCPPLDKKTNIHVTNFLTNKDKISTAFFSPVGIKDPLSQHKNKEDKLQIKPFQKPEKISQHQMLFEAGKKSDRHKQKEISETDKPRMGRFKCHIQ